MADLRAVVESLGHRDVATYVQSGNVVFTAAGDGADPAALAAALGRAIAAGSDVRPDVVVLTRDALARVVANNPYPDEADPTCVHVAFQQGGADDGAAETLAAAVERAAREGEPGRGRASSTACSTCTRRTGSAAASSPPSSARRAVTAALGSPATMRNWATVTRLLALLDEG